MLPKKCLYQTKLGSVSKDQPPKYVTIPIGPTYAGVVSREILFLAFTYAALNGLDICEGDLRNAYLQAPSSQKDFLICGA